MRRPKKKVHHDEEHGKTKKIAVSDFSFSKLCHRDFCETFSENFVFLKKMKNAKIVFFSPYVRSNCAPFPESKNKFEGCVAKLFPISSTWKCPNFPYGPLIGCKFDRSKFDHFDRAKIRKKDRFSRLQQNRRFCFAIFSVKNASTEKTEYTTTISAEKGKR